jgi:hypothetical protein
MTGTVSTVSQEIAAGLLEVESLNPLVVAIPVGGTSYPCSAGSVMSGSKLGEGGFGPMADARLVVRLSVFGATPIPARKSKVTFNSKTLRIDDLTTDPTGTYVSISLVDPARGV